MASNKFKLKRQEEKGVKRSIDKILKKETPYAKRIIK